MSRMQGEEYKKETWKFASHFTLSDVDQILLVGGLLDIFLVSSFRKIYRTWKMSELWRSKFWLCLDYAACYYCTSHDSDFPVNVAPFLAILEGITSTTELWLLVVSVCICLSAFVCLCLSVCLSVCLHVSLHVCVCRCMSVCICVCRCSPTSTCWVPIVRHMTLTSPAWDLHRFVCSDRRCKLLETIATAIFCEFYFASVLYFFHPFFFFF